ncbi:MAG: hypothetical protein PHO74_06375 [Weeksellaceae bacterium]|jgi:hypothetical protein|nr:hypothetical protein [Weeksellaceae bacterium]
MKTKIIVSLLFVFAFVSQTFACEVCEGQQPKILKGSVHGPGPESSVDFIITISAVIIVLFTLILSIKYLVKPGEKNPDHIKNIVLEQNLES